MSDNAAAAAAADDDDDDNDDGSDEFQSYSDDRSALFIIQVNIQFNIPRLSNNYYSDVGQNSVSTKCPYKVFRVV